MTTAETEIYTVCDCGHRLPDKWKGIYLCRPGCDRLLDAGILDTPKWKFIGRLSQNHCRSCGRHLTHD